MNLTRPPHIIPFFFPLFYSLIPEIIPYYSCNYSFLSVTFSYKNTIVHAVCKYWNYATPGWLSPTLSKAFMLPCDSCLSIARYAQLSQVCLHVAVSSNFEPWLGKFNPIIPELFFFYKRTYYSQRNSRLMCGGLNLTYSNTTRNRKIGKKIKPIFRRSSASVYYCGSKRKVNTGETWEQGYSIVRDLLCAPYSGKNCEYFTLSESLVLFSYIGYNFHLF